ncbi:Putative protein of unknown function [Podospora comata]|uniref:FAD-binding domain-containing protein n=1 Tax=Podospora comata TaxID=48703 RepID=A0ABY6SCH4_PODCO|nr:Putative protein of unknown function [Podospora comata]
MATITDTITGAQKPDRLHFVIVGGALGGLATGIALKVLGHNSTILEHHPTPLLHDQRASIVAGGHALEFFNRYSRCQRKDISVPSTCRQYLDRDGYIIHTVTARHNMNSWDLNYSLMRANYDGISSPSAARSSNKTSHPRPWRPLQKD